MAIVRPAITGDVVQDSWADQVTRAINNGTLGSGGGGGIGGGSGTGPAGVDGFNTATIYLFRRSLTDTAPDTISVSTTYTYDDGVLIDGEGNTGDPSIDGDDITGWYRAIPDEDDGSYIWTIQVSVADQGGSDTISATTWSAVTLLAQAGEDAYSVVINAYIDDPDSNQVVSWTTPFNGVIQSSPNFKNDTARVIGLAPTVYKAGVEIVDNDFYNAADIFTWSKNGDPDFTPNEDQVEGTGKTSRVLLINEQDIRDGDFNEVFNLVADF